ncbi:unnamed protein product [Dovyalis caffra]|uniref:Uncharacterized protein n=1 Tax=Dovyalis caffra TaxID=77055 RepID=A0AAV1RRX0_9ROSI|nr:unnamed protein product [Dovyalis caffra]
MKRKERISLEVLVSNLVGFEVVWTMDDTGVHRPRLDLQAQVVELGSTCEPTVGLLALIWMAMMDIGGKAAAAIRKKKRDGYWR